MNTTVQEKMTATGAAGSGNEAPMSLEKRDSEERVLFTKEMKDSYTLLIPMMAPIHFALVRNVFANEGYNVVLLTNNGPGVVEELSLIHIFLLVHIVFWNKKASPN